MLGQKLLQRNSNIGESIDDLKNIDEIVEVIKRKDALKEEH